VRERCGASRCDNSSAEVVTEDPGKLGSKTNADFPLADSSTTKFWNIKVTDQAGLEGNFDTAPWQDYQITMTDKSSKLLMATSSLSGNGAAFQTFWKREY
jgi:hypothetical protein